MRKPRNETRPCPLSRSEVMSRVKGKDTKPEMRVRLFLHHSGLRFRLHDRELPGKPDIVFLSKRCVIFVHGCFWHRHPGCPSTRTPKSRIEFWEKKFIENVERDARVRQELEAAGWRVVVVWECETKIPERLSLLAVFLKELPVLHKKEKRGGHSR